MYFLISNQNTHGEDYHWDVTVTSHPEIVSRERRISPDLEIEGWDNFVKSAKEAHIKSVSVFIELLDGLRISEDMFAKLFEVSDYEIIEELKDEI